MTKVRAVSTHPPLKSAGVKWTPFLWHLLAERLVICEVLRGGHHWARGVWWDRTEAPGDHKIPSSRDRVFSVDDLHVGEVMRLARQGRPSESGRGRSRPDFSFCGWRPTSWSASKKTQATALCLGLRGIRRRCCRDVGTRSESPSKRRQAAPPTSQAPAPWAW